MSVDRPIFILGPHRSGTTLLYRLLARHPETGYFNRNNKRFPNSPLLAHLLRALMENDLPMEAQPVWDRALVRDDDTLTAADATPQLTAWFRSQVERVLHYRDAQRFIAKYPRLSFRVGWLDAVFPDAVYLHMCRDWRAVVNSTVKRHVKRDARGDGWFGVRMPGWRELEARGDLDVSEIATHQFVAATRALEDAAPAHERRWTSFWYEDLCADPLAQMRHLCDAFALGWTERYEQVVEGWAIRDRADAWKTELGEAPAERLRAIAPELLARYESPAAG